MTVRDEISSSEITAMLEAIKPSLLAIDPPCNWTTKKALDLSYARIVLRLKEDLKALEKTASFVFDQDYKNFSKDAEDLLRLWQMQEKSAPSLTALCVYACEHFKIAPSHPYFEALIFITILGSVSHDLQYHNVMHYRKVLLQSICMIKTHNQIYAGTTKALSSDQIMLMLMAACGHDIGHDGLGNTIKGVYEPSRLEMLSISLIYQYLGVLGITDEKVIIALRAMIMSTDVTPMGDPTCPANQMKAAYAHHYLNTNKTLEPLNLDEALKPLETDPDLALMALMLHESDIATSAGISYNVTQYETALLCEEIGNEKALPEHVLSFLNMICNRQMLSQAGQQLYAANMARIIALTEEDYQNGNQEYPSSKYSYFLNPYHSAREDEERKTIN